MSSFIFIVIKRFVACNYAVQLDPNLVVLVDRIGIIMPDISMTLDYLDLTVPSSG